MAGSLGTEDSGENQENGDCGLKIEDCGLEDAAFPCEPHISNNSSQTTVHKQQLSINNHQTPFSGPGLVDAITVPPATEAVHRQS
jgi:hypothetical protein